MPETELETDPNANPANDADGSSAELEGDASTEKSQEETTSDTDLAAAGATSAPSVPTTASSPILSGATPGDATTEINPSNALSGTSGVTNGNNLTGMAAGTAPVKAASTQPAPEPTQPALPGLPVNAANVNVAVAAPHPIVYKAHGLVADLKEVLANIEKSPAILRAEVLLKEVEDWIVQHFEDKKRQGL